MGSLTAKTSGEIASFMSPSKTNIKSLKVHFSPKQLGTGDPSPENVREILGWDGVEVNGSGKNLINLNTIKREYRVNIQGEVVPAATYCLTDYIPVFSSSKYYLSNAGELAANACTAFYDKNKELLNTTRNITPITTPDNCAYIRCSFKIENTDIVQLELGSTVTSYEPYQGNTISYQWKLPDEYQEVEWIQSTGEKQFILLPYGFEETDTVTITASIDTKYITDGYLVAPTAWNNNKNRFAMVGVYQSKYCIGYGNRSTSSTRLEPMTDNDGDMHTWTYANKIFDITDLSLSINVSNAQFGGVTSNLKLFYGYNKNIDGKLSYYKHVKLNGEVYEFIPCYRKADAEIGLYDIANNVFYTNDGTGTFLKGNDVDKTFYGGYVDLISGELVEEWGMFTVDEPDTTWKVNHPARIIVNFPRKYIFSSRTMPRKSMCTIIPERSGADFNYGYLDNVSSIEHDHVLFLNYTGNGEGWAELFGEEATNENVKPHLQELGFAICATLVEPITHQLTPTQLQSFIGQNNFWSNADYVEVEYDLIETIDIQKAKQKIILNQPHTESVIDDVANFTTNMKAPLKECKVYFNPIQEGNGDPSPDNVRNIIGWDGVNVYQSRKNLCDNSKIKKGYFVSAIDRDTTYVMGHEISYNSSVSVSDYIKVEENSQYTCSFQYMPYSAMGFIFFSEKNEESAISSLVFETDIRRSPYTFIVPSNCKYIRINTINLKDEPQILLELGNTATLYEPYQGTTTSISWSDNVGTVYGGYVDLAKGELVAEWNEKMINSFDWSYNSSGECFRASANIKRKNVNAISPIQSKIYKTTKVYNSISYWLNVDDFSISEHTGTSSQGELINSIHIKDSRYTTVSDFLNGVGNESIIYELAEPIHYSLTPQQLLTFKGENNIWSDTNGQTEVKFWTH